MSYSLIYFLVYFLFCIIFVESLTELLRKSSILEIPRKFLMNIRFFNSLLSCGYCTSVWISFLPSASVFIFLQSLLLYQQILLFLFFTLVIHRCSNYLHNINDKYFDKFYKNL